VFDVSDTFLPGSAGDGYRRAKANNIDAAMAHVEMITTPRERIAALVHVARMVDDANMKPLPRYL
jgi:hypothetical protein